MRFRLMGFRAMGFRRMAADDRSRAIGEVDDAIEAVDRQGTRCRRPRSSGANEFAAGKTRSPLRGLVGARGGRWCVIVGLAVLAACHSVRIPADPSGPADAEDTAARVLPLREMRVSGDSGGRVMAIVLTGDAPVRGLGDRLGRDLARTGVPAVVWSSFRYYLAPKTPEDAAADLDRVIRHYLRRWERDRVVLVGYSMGADVLPFLVNRLPPETRSRIGGVALLALANDAVFAFRVEQWWGTSGAPALATRPEVERLADLRVLCVHGRGDPRGACPSMQTAPVTVVELKGGHHFTGSHRLLSRILADLARAAEAG